MGGAAALDHGRERWRAREQACQPAAVGGGNGKCREVAGQFLEPGWEGKGGAGVPQPEVADSGRRGHALSY